MSWQGECFPYSETNAGVDGGQVEEGDDAGSQQPGPVDVVEDIARV